jgi:hypothetical protein
LNRWIIARTRSGQVCTSRAITATSLPPAEADTIARRHFTIERSDFRYAVGLLQLPTLHVVETPPMKQTRHRESWTHPPTTVVRALVSWVRNSSR